MVWLAGPLTMAEPMDWESVVEPGQDRAKVYTCGRTGIWTR